MCVKLVPSSLNLYNQLVRQAHDGDRPVRNPALVDTDLVRAVRLGNPDPTALHHHGVVGGVEHIRLLQNPFPNHFSRLIDPDRLTRLGRTQKDVPR